MKSIQKLDSRTARLLHSSQSVASVSSIVKEIVENSLDAGATNVVVKLVDYGLDRIEVIDNGYGVGEDDLPLVVLPGYTSKIRSSEDLLSLATYGFRGQALAAVAAVSRVTIASGPQDSEQGLALCFDSQGNIVSQKVLPWNGGTRVTIEDIFKNIPVRRKHMDTVKAKSAQLKKVQHFLHAMAIACPGIGLSLHHNKSVIWTKVPVKTMREAIGQVYGISILQMLHYSEARDDNSGTVIKLFVPDMSTTDKEKLPSSSEPDRSIILVNGRPVSIKEMTQFLQKEFSSALGTQDGSSTKHPICVISLDVPPSELDVNLEPDKTAVVFSNKDAVVELFEDLVRKAFSSASAKNVSANAVEESVTTVPLSSDNLAAQTQKDLEAGDDLDGLFEDFVMPDDVCEDLECQINRDLPATPDGNKENVVSLTEKAAVPPDKPSAPCENLPEVLSQKTLTPSKTIPTPPRMPERQASLWSLGILQNTQGKTVTEPTRVGGGIAEKRPMISPLKDRTPSKRMRMPARPSGVHSWLKDMLSTEKRSAKETYCARRKKEILSQVPEMPLMELNVLLEEGWNSLTPDEKQQYEKQTGKVQTDCNKPSGMLQQAKESGPPKESMSTWKIVELQFSMQTIKEHFEDYCHLSQKPLSLDTTLVGPLRGCPTDAWVVWHKARLCTLNTARLREAITFKRLVASYPISAEEADPPITVTPAILGGDLLWNTLLNMKNEARDTSGFLYVTDPLLTSNGFHIRILPGSKAEIVQLPKDQALSELLEILKMASSCPSATVATCRLPRTVALLREEAARMVRKMPPKMSRDEVKELLVEQQDLLQELCVHNRPICTRFFDMSTSFGHVPEDTLSQVTL
ncbi:PMS1 protein homolog 1-like isoform X1 [Dermacentor variabilis]|uniref:PMS1 protein homolog 1-like isoform X1 n=3 Tax=Dermacentor variabilis TaxID=34621 RepID=UPI003F5C76D8